MFRAPRKLAGARCNSSQPTFPSEDPVSLEFTDPFARTTRLVSCLRSLVCVVHFTSASQKAVVLCVGSIIAPAHVDLVFAPLRGLHSKDLVFGPRSPEHEPSIRVALLLRF